MDRLPCRTSGGAIDQAIPGATLNALTLDSVVPDDAGLYSVVVSNTQGSIVSTVAPLSVTGAPPVPIGPMMIAAKGGVDVAVNGSAVVWTGGGSGFVHATSSLCPGRVRSIFERVGSDDAPWRLVLTDSLVFWCDGNNGSIWRAGLGSESQVRLAQSANMVYSITRSGSDLLWTDPAGANLQVMSVDGGRVSDYALRAASGTAAPNAVAVDDRNVYWNDVSQQTVNEMPLGGGPITTLASGQGYLSAIATDGGDVFWISVVGAAPNQTTYEMKTSRNGGTPQQLATLPTTFGAALVVDRPYIYWTAQAISTPTAIVGSGSLSRVPADGAGVSEVVVGELMFPAGVATDTHFVYWIEDSLGPFRGRVMRLAK